MVDVFMVYSKTDEAEALQFSGYLEQKNDLDGNALPPSVHESRNIRVLKREHTDHIQKEAAKDLGKSAVLLFIQGEAPDTVQDTIWWEIESALSAKKPVMVLQLGEKRDLPVWLYKKVLKGFDIPSFEFEISEVARAKRYTKKEIKDKLDHFATKTYDVFSQRFGAMSEDWPKETSERFFEQYKIYIQTSEDLISRRQSMNQFYLTLNTALMTFFGVVFGLVKLPGLNKFLVLLIVSIAGCFFNFSWRRTLDSYKILNTGKMRLINSIERQLPLRLFDVEYQIMKDELNPWKYVTTTESERNIPLWFSILYIVLTIASLFVPVAVE